MRRTIPWRLCIWADHNNYIYTTRYRWHYRSNREWTAAVPTVVPQLDHGKQQDKRIRKSLEHSSHGKWWLPSWDMDSHVHWWNSHQPSFNTTLAGEKHHMQPQEQADWAYIQGIQANTITNLSMRRGRSTTDHYSGVTGTITSKTGSVHKTPHET